MCDCVKTMTEKMQKIFEPDEIISIDVHPQSGRTYTIIKRTPRKKSRGRPRKKPAEMRFLNPYCPFCGELNEDTYEARRQELPAQDGGANGC